MIIYDSMYFCTVHCACSQSQHFSDFGSFLRWKGHRLRRILAIRTTLALGVGPSSKYVVRSSTRCMILEPTRLGSHNEWIMNQIP